MRLECKTVLITGAASGIGLAFARRCLGEGATVVAVDRSAAGLSLIEEGDAQARLYCLAGDVRDRDLAARAVALAEEKGGRLDGLATVAGISRSGIGLEAIAEEDWDLIFAVNVKATWLYLRATLPAFRRGGGGAVVTVASQLAFGGGAMNAAYIASKGAIVSLTKTAALELAADGVRVNAIAPGATETPLFEAGMARNPNPAARETSRNRHALKRFGRPEEIASGMLYLISDEAGWTTGHTLLVDGGWTAA